MAREDIEDVKNELKENEKRFYGEETVSGSSPSPESDDDVKEMVREVIGNTPKEGKPFSIAEEIEKDEKAIKEK